MDLCAWVFNQLEIKKLKIQYIFFSLLFFVNYFSAFNCLISSMLCTCCTARINKSVFGKKVSLIVNKSEIRHQLKLILNHQESRTLENHNMFKFGALLGETCLHKKGKQQTYFKCTAQYV
jgi:hypothetical protein